MRIAMLVLGAGLAATTVSSGCAGRRGEPAVVSHDDDGHATYEVGEFTRVEIDGRFEAKLAVGSPQRVELSGDPYVLEDVHVHVRGGELEVRMHSHEPHRPIEIVVVTPTLDAVELNGATHLQVDGLDRDTFALEVNGTARAKLRGHVDTFQLQLNGAGRPDSTPLKAQEVDVEINGSGRADVTALAQLSAEINGTGRVRYGGSPKTVAKSVNGLGWVKPL